MRPHRSSRKPSNFGPGTRRHTRTSRRSCCSTIGSKRRSRSIDWPWSWISSVPLPHRNLAVALARLGRVDEAVAEYRAALRAEPKATFACELGDLLAKNGRTAEAAQAYEQAPRNGPQQRQSPGMPRQHAGTR